MLKWIFAVVILVVVWAATILFELPFWPAILITLLVILALVAVFVIRRFRARRAARELEKALAAQAAEQARSARPDLQAEIQEMQNEFQKAITALKGSKLQKGGKNALYALPWYVIIGPPGSGKSTALRNSGIQFPYQSQSGGSVRGVGGTRNCDWWLTNEAVLLDTAGRWSTEDEDREEWQSFLDLTKKFRSRKPLNGMLVAVSVGDLGGAHEDEVVALAKQIRDRVDEVMARLQMSLPVYLLFTKCDLVPGFVETFSDLDRNSRGQMWGFTAPLATSIGEPGGYFNQRFDELATVVETRALRRMGEERRIESREKIHEFPQQFGVLKKNLGDFVSALFAENVFQETPQFRGAYFTSGTQEGRPIDRLMSRMAEAFGLQGRVAAPEHTVDPKSYFLRDVFAKVVFQDKDIAVRSAAEVRRQRIRQAITAAAIFFLALLISTLPAYTWFKSRSFLKETEEIARTAAEDGDGTDLGHLDALRDRTALLFEYEEDGSPVSMGLGMYRGDEVYPHLRELYTDIYRDKVLTPIVSQDLERMNEFGRRFEAFENARPSGEEHGRFYNVLKSHLLLSQPAEDNQPSLDLDGNDEEKAEEMQAWLSNQLQSRWAERTESEIDSPEAEGMLEHTQFYVSLLPATPELLFARDEDTVRRTRNALNRISGESLALNQIIAQFDGRGYDVTLPRLVGSGNALRARDGARVRGAFTRRAWEEEVFEILAAPPDAFLGEGWVLGREIEGGEATEEQLDNLRRQYFRQYVAEWREFVDKVRASAAGGHVEALELIQQLTRGDPRPLASLINQVYYNSVLPVPQEEEETEGEEQDNSNLTQEIRDAVRRQVSARAGRLGAALVSDAADRWNAPPGPDGITDTDPRYVKEQFEGFSRLAVLPEGSGEGDSVPIDIYHEQLQFVRDALRTYIDDPSTSDELMGKLQTARTTVRGLIEEQQIGWRPNFEQLLWPPIDSAAVNSSMALAMGAGRSWCGEVSQPYDRTIRGRYPFNRNGHDVPLSDFTEFFLPQTGTLWAFYDEVLDRDIGLVGNRFEFTRRLGRDTDANFVSSVVNFLNRAHDVTNTFFPPGAEGPRVEFDVRIQPTPEVATIDFTVDGQLVAYENAPERWTRVHWPDEDAEERGAFLEIRGANGMHEYIRQEGEWGLFRLIESGTIASRGTGMFTVVWRLHTHDVDITLEVRPAREQSPFFGVPGRTRNPNFLQPTRTNVDAPREIVVGARTCNR